MNDTSRDSIPAPLRRYFDAWNSHDADAIADTFVDGGFYTDPLTNGPLTGKAIGAYAQALWASFPDLRFELDGVLVSDGETACMPWKMIGTNSGPFRGLPPSGKSVALRGADIVQLAADGLRSVTGYFDSRAVPEQLGLQVIVQSHSNGPFTFGVSTRVTADRTCSPGAFSVTSLEPRTPEESEEIRQLGRETLKEMLGMEGFIASTTVKCGKRQMTFSAREKPEHVHQLRDSKAHNEAIRRFYGKDLARGGLISIWQPEGTLHTMQRCPQCDTMNMVERSKGQCQCGAKVEPPSYW